MQFIGQAPKETILSDFREHVSSGKADFFASVDIDFVFGKRQGPYIWDTHSNKKLINCHCNGGVFNLGHRNPLVLEALHKSMEELDIGNHHFVSETRAALARKLSAILPGDMSYAVFGVSGGEAIDLAIKLARGYTGKLNIISATGGYHGHTGLALAAGDQQYRDPFGPNPPGFIQIPFNNKDVLEVAVDNHTAAVIFETIPATYGIPIPDPDYFSFVKDLCHQNGALLIVDEVQTGLGRTGRMWGIDHFNVVPDIMVLGKGLSGGIYPMTATCFAKELESFFHQNPFIHVSTFGGAEIGCPVAMAVLDHTSRPGFMEHVNQLADIFADGLLKLQEKHPQILVGLRQLGLMMGIEMVHQHCGPILSKTLYDNGILSVYANNNPRVSQLLPPLTIDADLAYEIIDKVDCGLDQAKKILRL